MINSLILCSHEADVHEGLFATTLIGGWRGGWGEARSISYRG